MTQIVQSMPSRLRREESIAGRVQLQFTHSQLAAVDDVRFSRRFASRAQCLHDLIRRGMATIEREQPTTGAEG